MTVFIYFRFHLKHFRKLTIVRIVGSKTESLSLLKVLVPWEKVEISKNEITNQWNVLFLKDNNGNSKEMFVEDWLHCTYQAKTLLP